MAWMDRPSWMSTTIEERAKSAVLLFLHKHHKRAQECRTCLCATFSELHPSAANMSRPRSAPTILAFGKLGACVTLPSIDPDSCLPLKIQRRHSIGNKERQAEQSSCLCRHTRTAINHVWNILASRLAALFGVPTASFNAAGNATERQQ